MAVGITFPAEIETTLFRRTAAAGKDFNSRESIYAGQRE